MFKNMRLGTKIHGGIQIVLLLLAVMTFQGYNGVSSIADRVESDISNMIIKWTMEARQPEPERQALDLQLLPMKSGTLL